jgi:hypothetical protein
MVTPVVVVESAQLVVPVLVVPLIKEITAALTLVAVEVAHLPPERLEVVAQAAMVELE